MEPLIWVEFNDLDGSGEVVSDLRFAVGGASFRAGDLIWVGDHENNVCQATVMDVNAEGRVRLALDLDTFQQVTTGTTSSV